MRNLNDMSCCRHPFSRRFDRGPPLGPAGCRLAFALGVIAVLQPAVPRVAAASLYWDTNGATAGAGSSPSGTWSGTAADWTTKSAGNIATVGWTSGDTAVFSAGTDATGSFTVNVVGTQTLAGLTVQDGSPTLAGGTLSFSGSAPAINVAAGSTATLNSLIDSSTGFVKKGDGTLIVGNTSNAYTGATKVNAGTLQLGAANVLPGDTALTVASGATFDLSWGNSQTVGSIAGAGTIDIRSNTLTVGSDNSSTTFSGTITDGGAYGTLVKTGTGTLTLSGSNTYSGLTNITAGTVVAANDGALGGSTYGNTVADGAALQLKGGSTVTEGSFTVTGSGSDGTGALRSLTGSNTLAAAVNLGGSTTVSSDGGSALNVSGQVNLGSSNALTVSGNGTTEFSGAINGGGEILKTGSGTLTFSGSSSNSFSGGLDIASGTVVLAKTAGTNATGGGAITVGDGTGRAGSAVLQLGASNQIPDYVPQVTINSDGKLALNGLSESLNVIAGTGVIDFGTGGYLQVGGNSGSSLFGGSLTGTGTLEKAGSGSLTFASSITFAGDLTLSGGTLALNGTTLTVGVLHITGNTVIDFGSSSASILNASSFVIDSGATLSVTGWASTVDYFYAQSWAGAVHDTSGLAPLNQVAFSGYTSSSTAWQSYDNQLTPAPEPAVYGALFTGLAAALVLWRRRRPA